MERRRLGQSDLHIAPLMLGGNVFGWTVDEATSFALLDASSTPGSTPSTQPTPIRAGSKATRAANPKR